MLKRFLQNFRTGYLKATRQKPLFAKTAMGGTPLRIAPEAGYAVYQWVAYACSLQCSMNLLQSITGSRLSDGWFSNPSIPVPETRFRDFAVPAGNVGWRRVFFYGGFWLQTTVCNYDWPAWSSRDFTNASDGVRLSVAYSFIRGTRPLTNCAWASGLRSPHLSPGHGTPSGAALPHWKNIIIILWL